MKNYLKLALICSIYCSDIAVNIACGPEEDPYDMQTSYYLPNRSAAAYSAFQYIPSQFLYGETEPQSEAAINASLWAAELKVPATAVQELMYETDSATAAALQARQTPDSLANNRFLQALQQHPQAWDYFLLTKEAEVLTNKNMDYWNPEPIDTKQTMELSNRAKAQIASFKKGSFLYLRYAYQAARLALIAKEYRASMDIYEQYIAPLKSKDPMMGWALSNYAGATRWEGNPEQAALLFARVFSMRPERRILAYKNYNYIQPDITQVVSLAKTDEDRFNAYAISGFNNPNPSMTELQACYKLNPKHEIIPLLLNREINKLETKLVTPFTIAYGYFSWFEDEDKIATKNQLIALRNFSLQLAKDKKIQDPALGTVAAAYLSFINKENSLAKDYLAQLKQQSLSPQLADQYRITQMLTSLDDWKKDPQQDEQQLLSSLSWLWAKAKQEQPDTTVYSNFKDAPYSLVGKNILNNIIVPHYLAVGDTSKASLAALKADIFANNGQVQDTLGNNLSYDSQAFWQKYLSSANVTTLIDAFQHPQKQDAFTQFLLADITQVDYDELHELAGTAHLREHNYAAAIKSFGQMKSPENTELVTDYYGEDSYYAAPFKEQLKDYPKQRGTTYYSKLSYAKDMQKLLKESLITSDREKLAATYFKLALGEYQTSTYGNSWMLKSYEWSSSDAHDSISVAWEQDYKQTQTAKVWFEKALSLSQQKEFKAKCVFWLAKCHQKNFQYTDENRWTYYEQFSSSPFYQFTVNNPYFRVLKSQYRDTKLYQTAVHECSYLADFIKK